MLEEQLQLSPKVDKPPSSTAAGTPADGKTSPKLKRTARGLILRWDNDAHSYRVLIGIHAKGTVKKDKPGFPGGGPNPGERLTRTMRREVREETDLRLMKKLDDKRWKTKLADRPVVLTYFIGFLHPKDEKKLVGNTLLNAPERDEFVGARFVLPEELEREDLDLMMEADIVMWRKFAKPRIEELNKQMMVTLLHSAMM